ADEVTRHTCHIAEVRPGMGSRLYGSVERRLPMGLARAMQYTCQARVYSPLFDRLLYRHPFEGSSARRYARDARPAFGDFDDRLLDRLAPALGDARRLLDLGCGPGTLAQRAIARFAQLHVVAIDPSRDFARGSVVRAAGEALPLADR